MAEKVDANVFTTMEKNLSSQLLIIAADLRAQSKWQHNEWCVASVFVCDAAHFLNYNAP